MILITNAMQLQPIETKEKKNLICILIFLCIFVHASNRRAGSVGRASPDARFVDSRYDQS
jgi:hypothetical protein